MSRTSVASSPAARRAARRADTAARLVAAAEEELRAAGHEGLTVRNVAGRAGVAPATAYTYFSSKDHLVAELFWRRVAALDPVEAAEPGDGDPPDGSGGPGEPGGTGSLGRRLVGALRDVALVVADEPELAAACTQALLAGDPDVARLRDRIGGAIHDRLAAAAGPQADPGLVEVLDLLYSGAMLQTGTGHLSSHQLTDRLTAAVAVLVHEPVSAVAP